MTEKTRPVPLGSLPHTMDSKSATGTGRNITGHPAIYIPMKFVMLYLRKQFSPEAQWYGCQLHYMFHRQTSEGPAWELHNGNEWVATVPENEMVDLVE